MIFRYIRNMSAGKSERKPDVRERPPSPSKKGSPCWGGQVWHGGREVASVSKGKRWQVQCEVMYGHPPPQTQSQWCLSPYTQAEGIYQRILGHVCLLESETQNFNTIDNPQYLLSFLMLFRSQGHSSHLLPCLWKKWQLCPNTRKAGHCQPQRMTMLQCTGRIPAADRTCGMETKLNNVSSSPVVWTQWILRPFPTSTEHPLSFFSSCRKSLHVLEVLSN